MNELCRPEPLRRVSYLPDHRYSAEPPATITRMSRMDLHMDPWEPEDGSTAHRRTHGLALLRRKVALDNGRHKVHCAEIHNCPTLACGNRHAREDFIVDREAFLSIDEERRCLFCDRRVLGY